MCVLLVETKTTLWRCFVGLFSPTPRVMGVTRPCSSGMRHGIIANLVLWWILLYMWILAVALPAFTPVIVEQKKAKALAIIELSPGRQTLAVTWRASDPRIRLLHRWAPVMIRINSI